MPRESRIASTSPGQACATPRTPPQAGQRSSRALSPMSGSRGDHGLSHLALYESPRTIGRLQFGRLACIFINDTYQSSEHYSSHASAPAFQSRSIRACSLMIAAEPATEPATDRWSRRRSIAALTLGVVPDLFGHVRRIRNERRVRHRRSGDPVRRASERRQ